MADNYVTQEQFLELKEEMQEGFAEIKQSQAALDHKLEMMIATLKTQNDERYAQQKDEMNKALLRLDDPIFVEKATHVCDYWVTTEKGKDALAKAYAHCVENTRDSGVKWLKAIETFIKLLIAVAAIYGGSTVINTQKSNQRALLEKIEQVQGE